jgi:hypothetical protein
MRFAARTSPLSGFPNKIIHCGIVGRIDAHD